MAHLMTDYYTNTTIVERVVSIHVKERRLQNTSWEANLIGSRTIVSIYCLRSHVPLCWVNRLAKLVNLLLISPQASHLAILIV